VNRLSLTVAVALSVLALAACGSSSHKSHAGSSTNAAPITLAAFKSALVSEKTASVKLGNALVKALNNAGHMSNATFAATFGALGTQFTAFAAGLGHLQAPAKYRGLLAALQHAFATVASDVTSLAQSTTAAQSHARTLQLAADIQKLPAAEQALGNAVGLPKN
jgi:hypothetical protein